MSEIYGVFERPGARVVLRPFAPGDEAGFVACYNRVFPRDDPRVPPMTAAEWRWKYALEPTGRREIMVAVDDEEGIVGAYPTQPMRAFLDGRPIHSAQVTDLMVRHEFRRVGRRPGLFVALGRAFYERYCGSGEDRQAFQYGWPVPAWRVGQRYLDYLNVRDWNFLGKEVPVERSRLAPIPAGLEVEELRGPLDVPEVDALFASVRATTPFTLARDAAWFEWRYRQSPRPYRLALCRDVHGGALRGVVVYRVADFGRPHTAFVVDWLVRPDDADAIAGLVAWCEHRARDAETGAIAGVWNPVDPRFPVLQRLGWDLWDSGYFLVVSTFRPTLDTHFFRAHWHFTMGESDLV